MAKQIGQNLITGTIDELTFYKMHEQYYVRMKSTLCGKRVKSEAIFAKTMESAKQLGYASIMASNVYKTISADKRNVQLYRKLTGIAKILLRDGEEQTNIIMQLMKFIVT